jgi:predicted dehydrogenase
MFSSENLDFVDIATPPSTHATLASAALARGLHVLCEKPLVFRAEEVPPLAALARERERALVTVHNWKNAPVLAKAAGLVREGAVGHVTGVAWKTLRTQPAVTVKSGGGNWRIDPALAGGGILVDHGWHALYVVLGWLPEPPKWVSATLENRKYKDSPMEDTATVRLESGGTTAEILLTWASEERANRAEITGTRGRLRLDGGRLALFQTPSSLRSPSGPAGDWKFPSLAEGSHHPEWFDGVIVEFFGEIEDPARRGQNLKEAALCAEIIDLAKKSSRRGGEALEVKGLA